MKSSMYAWVVEQSKRVFINDCVFEGIDFLRTTSEQNLQAPTTSVSTVFGKVYD